MKGRVAFFLFAALSLSACAPGILGVKQSLADSQAIASTAIKGFEAFDAQHQLDLVAAAPTSAAAKLALDAYRAQRKAVLLAASTLNAAFAAAGAAINLAMTKGAAIDYAVVLGPVLKAAQDLQAAILAMKAPPAPISLRITMEPRPILSRYMLHRREVAPHLLCHPERGGGVA